MMSDDLSSYTTGGLDMNIQKLLTPDEAAEVLGISTATLAVWRCTNRYTLCHVKCGRLVRYREADIEAFISQRRHGGVPDPA